LGCVGSCGLHDRGSLDEGRVGDMLSAVCHGTEDQKGSPGGNHLSLEKTSSELYSKDLRRLQQDTSSS